MQIVRTIVWVLLLAALLIFSINNWNTVEVKIWEGLVLETKVPALVIVAFLLGLVPMWLLHRGTKWHFRRRISSLENAARSAAMPSAAPATTPATAPVTAPATPAEPAPYAEPTPFTEPGAEPLVRNPDSHRPGTDADSRRP